MNSARNADHAARTCRRFDYSIVKITRLYDYQTWDIWLFEKLMRCAKVCGHFSWLCFPDTDWNSNQMAATTKEKETKMCHICNNRNSLPSVISNDSKNKSSSLISARASWWEQNEMATRYVTQVLILPTIHEKIWVTYSEKWWLNQLASEQPFRCQVLHTVLHISGQKLKGENLLWSHLGLKRVNRKSESYIIIKAQSL